MNGSATDCFLCGSNVKDPARLDLSDVYKYRCETCGLVRITDIAVTVIKNQNKTKQRNLISSLLCELDYRGQRDVPMIKSDNMEDFVQSSFLPKTFSDKADKLLFYLSKMSHEIGAKIPIKDRKLQAIFYSTSLEEASFIRSYLVQDKLIEFEGNDQNGFRNYRLTKKGWDRVYGLEKNLVSSDQCFIAMSFSPTLKPIYENHIKVAVEETGYSPLRVDVVEHNDKIDDLIISEIKRSFFMIADVTEQKPGVYFEAGYAMGRSIPVIWSCREDEIREAHFDTRQYNHIVWQAGDDLRIKLVRRIQATIFGSRQEQLAGQEA